MKTPEHIEQAVVTLTEIIQEAARTTATPEPTTKTKHQSKNPSVLHKVHPIKGDVSLPYLSLSQEDRNLLLEKVNIVFHAAATVRFNEPLHVVTRIYMRLGRKFIRKYKLYANVVPWFTN